MDQIVIPWWKTGVIYHIYPRSFFDAGGDGIGDLEGIRSRLDYLTSVLSVEAIWLSPFYPSPMADFGYDVSDYCDVDPLFGDLDTFDRLVAASHDRNMRVIIDFVPNHTSHMHPWFIESRSSRASARRDWYIWADGAPGGGPPNNWMSAFGGSAWTFDGQTGQYYLHSYLSEQPDLNWWNEEVRETMRGVLRFWLDRGVDGFRFDAVHRLLKDRRLRDNPPNPLPTVSAWFQGRFYLYDEYDTQLHVYDLKQPEVHEIYRSFRCLLDESGPERACVAIGEVAPSPWTEWIAYYGADLDEFHLPLNFELIKAPWTAEIVRTVVDSYEKVLPPGSWPNYVLGSHDFSRLATRIGEPQSRVAALLLLTLRGTPVLYYGDELGLRDVHVPPDRTQDPFGKRYPEKSRDGCRAPMPWDPSGGFSTTFVAPWLPMPPNVEEVNVHTQRQQPGSMLNLYRNLIELRKNNTALHRGGYLSLDANNINCFLYTRFDDTSRFIVALNFTSQEQNVDLPGGQTYRIVLSTCTDRLAPAPSGHSVILYPDEGIMWKVMDG